MEMVWGDLTFPERDRRLKAVADEVDRARPGTPAEWRALAERVGIPPEALRRRYDQVWADHRRASINARRVVHGPRVGGYGFDEARQIEQPPDRMTYWVPDSLSPRSGVVPPVPISLPRLRFLEAVCQDSAS